MDILMMHKNFLLLFHFCGVTINRPIGLYRFLSVNSTYK